MGDPHAVYQLALRAGASYEATCLALERHAVNDASTTKRLLDTPRRDLKAALLDGFEVDNYYPDVWLLTELDEGATLEGQPDDLFVIKLSEQGGAGYLWTTTGLADSGFAILRDTRELPSPDIAIGGPTTRALTARHEEPASGDFQLELRRPWQTGGPAAGRLHVTYELFGKEVGMPRAQRRRELRAA